MLHPRRRRGNCRHFIFVEDVARAFITILHKGGIGETYNIGCEAEYTNLEVAEKLVKALKPTCKDPKEHIEFVPDRPFNDVRYYISSTSSWRLGGKRRSRLRRRSRRRSRGTLKCPPTGGTSAPTRPSQRTPRPPSRA